MLSVSGKDRISLAFALLLVAYIVLQAMCLFHVLAYFPNGFGTEGYYHPLAVNLLQHGQYALGDYPALEPSTFRPPFYPFVLSNLYRLFGTSEVVGLVFNNVLLTALIVMVFVVGRRLHAAVGLLAALFLMLDTVYLAQANRNQSDMLFAALITLAMMLAWHALHRPMRLGWVAATALVLALATFTRAAAMYLWIPLAVTMIVAHWSAAGPRRLLTAIAVVVAVQAAVVVPWMMRNEALTGNSDFAGMKGWHFTSFLAPLVIGKRDGIEPREAKLRIWAEIEADPNYPPTEDLGGQQRYLSRHGGALVLHNLPYLLLVVVDNVPKLFLSYPSEPLSVFLGPDSFQSWHTLDRVRHDRSYGIDTWAVERRLEQIRYYLEHGLIGILGYGVFLKALNGLVLLFAFVGLVLMWRSDKSEERRFATFLFLFYGCLTVISILVTQGRFRLPLMPGFALCAAYATWILVPRLLAVLPRRRSAIGRPA